jgi:hypothetical protein
MLRRLLLALALVSIAAGPLWAKPASHGVTVEIEAFEYTYFLGGDAWSMRCLYRVDGGEWRSASSNGMGVERALQIPGTTIHVGDPGNRTLQWNHDDDVRELRFERP